MVSLSSLHLLTCRDTMSRIAAAGCPIPAAMSSTTRPDRRQPPGRLRRAEEAEVIR